MIRRQRALGVLCGLIFTQTFIRGCFSVFVVDFAIQLLDLGESGVGLLTAAFGFGAVLGSFVAALLIGRTGFARYLGARHRALGASVRTARALCRRPASPSPCWPSWGSPTRSWT